MTGVEPVPHTFAAITADQFTLMRELAAELDRLTSGLPEIEIRRRNGVFRITTRLPLWLRDSVSVFVEGQSLVIESRPAGGRKKIPMPAEMNPADVGVRFFEGVLVVELPHVYS